MEGPTPRDSIRFSFAGTGSLARIGLTHATVGRIAPRPIRNHFADRRRRDGRSLSGARYLPRPRHRDQGARRGVQRTLPRRSPSRGIAQPSKRVSALRRWSQLLRPVRAFDRHRPIVFAARHANAPGVATDFAVLDKTPAHVRLEVDLGLFTAVRAGHDELVGHGAIVRRLESLARNIARTNRGRSWFRAIYLRGETSDSVSSTRSSSQSGLYTMRTPSARTSAMTLSSSR